MGQRPKAKEASGGSSSLKERPEVWPAGRPACQLHIAPGTVHVEAETVQVAS